MSDTIQQHDELLLAQNVIRFIEGTGVEGNGERMSVVRIPFYFPSIGTRFARVVYQEGDRTERYFVKSFDEEVYHPREGDPKIGKRIRTSTPPAEIENSFLKFFRNKGCPVPASEAINPYTLVMEDCGKEALEERLYPENPEEQETELAEIMPQQAKFAVVARQKYNPNDFPPGAIDRIVKRSNLKDTLTNLLRYWRPGASEEERKRLTKQLVPLFKSVGERPRQLILGDVATYHILYKDDKASWIDLEKFRLGHPTQDLSGLLLSPETKLTFEAVERLLYLFKQRELELAVGESVPQEEWRQSLRDFYISAMFGCFRRGTKIREFESNYPDLHENFITAYPGFANALDRYRQRVIDVSERVHESDFFDLKDRTALERAGETIIELMSK